VLVEPLVEGDGVTGKGTADFSHLRKLRDPLSPDDRARVEKQALDAQRAKRKGDLARSRLFGRASHLAVEMAMAVAADLGAIRSAVESSGSLPQLVHLDGTREKPYEADDVWTQQRLRDQLRIVQRTLQRWIEAGKIPEPETGFVRIKGKVARVRFWRSTSLAGLPGMP